MKSLLALGCACCVLSACASADAVRALQAGPPLLGPEHPVSVALAEEQAILKILESR